MSRLNTLKVDTKWNWLSCVVDGCFEGVIPWGGDTSDVIGRTEIRVGFYGDGGVVAC
jgi:hypothetical protein